MPGKIVTFVRDNGVVQVFRREESDTAGTVSYRPLPCDIVDLRSTRGTARDLAKACLAALIRALFGILFAALIESHTGDLS